MTSEEFTLKANAWIESAGRIFKELCDIQDSKGLMLGSPCRKGEIKMFEGLYECIEAQRNILEDHNNG